MAIPDYQTLMFPLLNRLRDGEPRRFAELVPTVAVDLHLSQEDLEELLPSGTQKRFRNRLHWAAFYMVKARLIDRPQRGILRITERGLGALQRGPALDTEWLQQFEEFREFKKSSGGGEDAVPGSRTEVDPQGTPEELVDSGYQQHKEGLASEVLARVKTCSPVFFEQLVIDVLVAMGYGGSRADAGRAVGRSGDGGIDGIIKEDRLGLDAVYVQAKRWEASVGRPVVQAFAGSLEGHRARKGILITTSDFSSEARDYVGRIEKRIVLLNGKELADLMIEHGVGVTDVRTYTLRRLDSDYFEEE